MKNSKRYIICLMLLLSNFIFGQEKATKKWELSGYQKSLQGFVSFKNPLSQKDTLLTDIFLHNRLHFKWYPIKELTVKAELRTRLFFGEFHNSIFSPNFKQQLQSSSTDYLNLQIISTGNQAVLHSVFDRLNIEYEKGDWEVTLGRQRINWGISTIWNPHDVFNAFSFLDFDYEERPGVDALRVKKYIGYSGGFEFAVKAFDNPKNFAAGMLYKINKWNYDFQFLASYAKQDAIIGAGWAGAIKNIGFKGEMSYFKATINDRKDTFTGTMGIDYGLKNGTYLTVNALYNATENNNASLFGFQLEASNLYPYQWSAAVSVTHPFTPLFSGTLNLIYSPVTGQPLFINPTLSYNLTQNLDVDVIGQLFYISNAGSYNSNTRLAFLRMKWSF